MKKILIVTPGYLPLLGGMEEQCFLLAKELTLKNCKVDILTERTEKYFLKFEQTEYADVYRIEKPNRNSLFGYFSLAINIFKFIKNHKDYDLVIIRTLTFPGLFLGLLKLIRILKAKTFITAETGGENDELDAIGRSKFRKLFVFLFGRHNYINSITEINYNKFIKLKFPIKKLTKIYNGVECEAFNKRNYPEKIQRFLFIAQLKKEKGIYELLEAFRMLLNERDTVVLDIAGDGPEKEGVEKFIKENNLEKNVIYHGRISREHRDEFYLTGDCLVLPSYSESFGLVYAEAAVNKRAIIATDVADLKQIYGKNILFSEKRNSLDLYQKMAEIMDKYSVGQIDYSEAIDKINIKSIVKELLNLY